MLLSEKVLVPINGRNCKHFENLGYDIPRYKDNNYRLCIKRGTVIEVNVNDLLQNSTVKVERKCDVCKEVSEVSYYQYRDVCKKCSTSGERNRNWNGGISKKKNYCECGRQIHWKSNKCLKCFQKGINNTNYNHNLSNEERNLSRSISGYTNWKKEVLIKYDYTCQKCGFNGNLHDGNLNVHHIENYSYRKDNRVDSDNGIVFCKECHKKFHRKYGKKNNNKIQLNEFLGVNNG